MLRILYNVIYSITEQDEWMEIGRKEKYRKEKYRRKI
jgi:hypothetical protein